jgi:xanthine dehydrogenase accessory factor
MDTPGVVVRTVGAVYHSTGSRVRDLPSRLDRTLRAWNHMSDQLRVVAALELAAERGEPVALVSVVETAGSAYRRCGARMVVRADGSTVGMVSAGCLEADLALQARGALESDRVELATHDGRAAANLDWGEGCGGVVRLLIEPLDPARAADLAVLLRQALEADEPRLLITVVHAEGQGAPAVGARLLLDAAGAACGEVGDWGDGRLRALSAADAPYRSACGERGCGLAVRDVGSLGLTSAVLCVENVRPVVRLLICGSGRDVEPVCDFARTLGWDVTVVDHRPASLVGAERFSGATVVECAEASRLGERVRITSRTATVVMSHHLARDTAYLGALLESGASYVGVLGPRARTERMLAELAAADAPMLERASAAVHGPAGLDIGGDGAEAIALSIVAEVQAVMHRRAADALRDRRGSIHVVGTEEGPTGASASPRAPSAAPTITRGR